MNSDKPFWGLARHVSRKSVGEDLVPDCQVLPADRRQRMGESAAAQPVGA